MRLSLGLSPCPNDTYIFAALLEGRSPLPHGCEDVSPHFADVEELNALARAGRLDISKVSAAVLPEILDEYMICSAGGALGRGCGPLLVTRGQQSLEDLQDATILVPGFHTTATLLLSLTGMFHGPRRECIFDEIMPAVAAGTHEAGVIIHESRFTYPEHGLSLALDLGEWWEKATGSPLPLGVIVVKRSLGDAFARNMDAAIRQSLENANAFPEKAMPFIQSKAQEMERTVLQRHIAMFVNDFSLSLGREGQRAVEELVGRSAALRGLPPTNKPLFVSP